MLQKMEFDSTVSLLPLHYSGPECQFYGVDDDHTRYGYTDHPSVVGSQVRSDEWLDGMTAGWLTEGDCRLMMKKINNTFRVHYIELKLRPVTWI